MLKLLCVILFITFSFKVNSNDISEYEIEGMSVGQSMLDFFTKKEISNIVNNPDNNKLGPYIGIVDYKNDNFKFYDSMNIIFKQNKKFPIEAVVGKLKFNSKSECIKTSNEASKDFSPMFSTDEKMINSNIGYSIFYWKESEDTIVIGCNYLDELMILFTTFKAMKFLNKYQNDLR